MRRRHLLAIATNYEGAPYALRGCLNDARSWVGWAECTGFDSVTSLLGTAATGEAIRGAITGAANGLKRGDTLFVPVSGHGASVPQAAGQAEADRRDEAFCPDDFQRNGLLYDNEIPGLLVGKAWGARVVLLFDSCHSGTMAKFAELEERGISIGWPPPEDARVRQIPVEAVPSWEVGGPGRRGLLAPRPLVLSAALDSEVAYDALIDGQHQGAFTWACMRALEESVNPSWAAVVASARLRVKGRGFGQTPGVDGSTWQKRWRVGD